MINNNNSNKKNDFKINVGTRLVAKHWGMSKHGIYIGRGKVLCYDKNTKTDGGSKIKITSLKCFYENW